MGKSEEFTLVEILRPFSQCQVRERFEKYFLPISEIKHPAILCVYTLYYVLLYEVKCLFLKAVECFFRCGLNWWNLCSYMWGLRLASVSIIISSLVKFWLNCSNWGWIFQWQPYGGKFTDMAKAHFQKISGWAKNCSYPWQSKYTLQD